MLDTSETGVAGENIAHNYLTQNLDYVLLEQNWRYKNHHEIDLIMLTPNSDLVAVEVRTHQQTQEYNPFESITPSKIDRLKEGLTMYANTKDISDAALRIDVVSVVISTNKLEHFIAVDQLINTK